MSDFAAVDLGAESGRVVRGRLDGGRVELEVVHRFANRPVRLPDGLRWNLLALFGEALHGLRKLAATSPLRGIGVDSWGVDYALLDGRGRVLGLPFHYRDGRTDGMAARAYARVTRDELYRLTGIQTMPINTVFQLLADEGSAALHAAQRIALVPDLVVALAVRRARQRGHERVHDRIARRARGHVGARADRPARLAGGAVRAATRSTRARRSARRSGTTRSPARRRCTRSRATTPRRRSSPRR